jgi:CO/xanthine dehydrogenase Mo-binding subunit
VSILLDSGAYASSSTAVTSNAASFAIGPYAVDNALIESTCLHEQPTVRRHARLRRGAVCFAHEAQMDKLADALDIDPIELRLLNALRPGTAADRTEDHRDAPRRRRDSPRSCARGLRPRSYLAAHASSRRSGNTTRGEGVHRGRLRRRFQNIGYSEATTTTPQRVQLHADGSATKSIARLPK